MKPYDKYTNLNEFWLNNIPQHWEQQKIKRVLTERSEKGYPEKPLLAATQNMGVVPKGVYGNRTVEATKDLHLLKLVKIGDFVISLRSFQGGIEYAYYEGIISPAYNILTPNNQNHSGYLKYLFKTIDFIELLKNCVTGISEGQNVDYSKLRDHIIPIPPILEQEQIVEFLDWKIEQINHYLILLCGKSNVEPKEIEKYPCSLTALLVEYRTRLISDVVTGKIDVREARVPEVVSRVKDMVSLKEDDELDEGVNL